MPDAQLPENNIMLKATKFVSFESSPQIGYASPDAFKLVPSALKTTMTLLGPHGFYVIFESA